MYRKPRLNMMSIITLLSVTMLLNGCTHSLTLAFRNTSESECPIRVTDKRPDPDFLYAHVTEGLARIKITPRLSLAVSKSVCSSLQGRGIMRPVNIIITDFDCVVTGFFEIRYVADLRGTLITDGNVSHDIRVSNVSITANGYIPSGCEAAALPLIDRLSDEISAALSQKSNKDIEKGTL